MDAFNHDVANQLAQLLQESQRRIVLAESCTAGLIAASLGRIPGISTWLAGSAVVYQVQTKAEWLDVRREDLENPGPVSQTVSEQMARGVLRRTPQATMAASVTGHLGPDAPSNLDGTAWSSVALRTDDGIVMTSRLLDLDQPLTSHGEPDIALGSRQHRQITAVQLVLQFCVEQLRNDAASR